MSILNQGGLFSLFLESFVYLLYLSNFSLLFCVLAVDRHRCIIQPDKPQFTSGVALLTTLLMVAASILLSLPMYQSAEVRNFTSFFEY